MKKRILSLIFVVCMAVALVPVMQITASSADTCTCLIKCTDSYKDPDCPVCSATTGSCLGRNLWGTISDTDGLQNAMNVSSQYSTVYFQLGEDFTLTKLYILVPENADVVLDLNGHTVTASESKGSYIFRVYGELTIIDTKGSGRLRMASSSTFFIAGSGRVLMKGGTIKQNKSGTAVYLTGGTFEMTGGQIDIINKNTRVNTGGIQIEKDNGTAIISGNAKITDSDGWHQMFIPAGTLYLDGGTIQCGIRIFSNGTVTSTHSGKGTTIEGNVNNGGTISAGTYTGKVNNYYISNGEILARGTISGGTYLGEVENIEDGTISGGRFANKVTNAGSISGGTFNAEADNQGTISGGMYSETSVVKNTGTISGGTFLGTVESENGTIEESAKVSVNFVNESGETIKTVRVLRGQRITLADLPEIDPTQYGYRNVKYTVGNTEYREAGTFIDEVRFTDDETPVTVTLISPITYTITYNLNGGSIQYLEREYQVTSDDITLGTPTKEGYVFTGWGGTDLEGTSNMTVTIPKGSIGDRKYTAYYWQLHDLGEVVQSIDYTVIFDTQGGSPVDPKKGLTKSSMVLEGVTEPTKAGYRFQWWKCGGSPVVLANTTVEKLKDKADSNGVITLTAVWREKETVTFDTAAQKYTYDGTEKAFEIKESTLDGFDVTYRKNGNTVEFPVDGGSYDVIVTRAEDPTNKAVNVTIPGGLVINPKEVTVTIGEIPEQTYTGNVLKPAITVSAGPNEIPANEYMVDYANNRNAGTATVTVTDRTGGNYTFTQETRNFTIQKKSITPAVAMADYVYGTDTGCPEVSVNEGGTVSVYYSTYDDIANNAEHRLLWDVDVIDGTTLNAGTYYMMAEMAESQNYNAGISDVITFRVMANQYVAPTVPTLNGSAVTIDEADRSKVLEYSLNGGKWVDVPALDSSGSFVLTGLAENTGYTLSLRQKASADGNYAVSDAVNCFFVAYNANGGTGTVPSGASASSGNSVTVASGDQLQRDGYTFGGWNTEADGTGIAYAAGSAITTGAALYAQWKDIAGPTGEISIDTNKWTEFLNPITFVRFFKDMQTVTITTSDNSGDAVTIEYLLSHEELTARELAAATFTAYNQTFSIYPDNEYVIYAKLTDTSGNMTYINSDGVVLDTTAPVISSVENGETYCSAQTVIVTEEHVKSVTVNGTDVTLDPNNQFTLPPAEGTQTIVVTDKAGNVSAEITVTVNDGHTDENTDHKCDICKTKLSEHSGGTATCKNKAVCEYCGSEYGEIDSSNHHLEKIPAKDATVTETGNTEYWHCKDCGKNFSDPDGKNTITLEDTVIANLPPAIIEGTGQSITAGDKEDLTFRSNVTFGDFIRVELDGKTLDKKNYTVKEGIIVVTLPADYVAKLSAGRHTIGIVSERGTATAVFTVNEKAWDKTVLRLKSSASKTSAKLKWNAVPEADGYVIYWNRCGAKSAYKPIKTIKSGKTLTWAHKNLKKNSQNCYIVKAYKVIDGKKSFIKTSNKIHLVTKGGKYTNVKKLKSKVSKVTLKKGKTKALKITQIYAEKNKNIVKHMRALTYTSSDKTVATVTSKGVIKAKGTGSCYIYITAHSGVYTRVKVTVK